MVDHWFMATNRVSLIDKNQHCKHSESPKSTPSDHHLPPPFWAQPPQRPPQWIGTSIGQTAKWGFCGKISGLGSYMKCEEIPNLSFLCIYIYVIYVIYHVDTTRINSSMQLHHSQVQTHSGGGALGSSWKVGWTPVLLPLHAALLPYIPIQRSLIP